MACLSQLAPWYPKSDAALRLNKLRRWPAVKSPGRRRTAARPPRLDADEFRATASPACAGPEGVAHVAAASVSAPRPAGHARSGRPSTHQRSCVEQPRGTRAGQCRAAGLDAFGRSMAGAGLLRHPPSPLLVATDGAAVAAFGRDIRRLRPNIVIAGVEGLAERDWAGMRLHGDAVVRLDSASHTLSG